MPVDVIGDVTRCENPRNACRRRVTFNATLRTDVAARHIQLTGEDFCIRYVTNGNEDTRHVNVLSVAFFVGNTHAGDASVISENLRKRVVPDGFDVVLRKKSILQDFFCPEFVTPMNEVDLAADVGQVQRFLGSSVSTTNNCDFLVSEEKAIAGCACADTATFVGVL